ncbi:bifunctional diguanylate cyclase/phosphodiesterase [Streptomyces sp. NP160]|uniref:putative bifunctional diguanylate cyclase/phosphodiesterase n=1 Tax=Streptomyces sp. NP160 TaxID=2586637 RepID=UPI001118B838|nr:bifunctional diguanylate cyclase/phosphodiesterase [Streptomyces sp. NP160]TNM61543.1 bifunctional diguanylate cyclase/phosphodiesterase [Streptomyces sp. NP160]
MLLRQRRVAARTVVCAATAGAVVAYAALAAAPWTSAWAGALSLLPTGVAVLALAVLALVRRQDGRMPWLVVSAGLVLAVVLRTAAAAQLGTGGPVLPADAYARLPWLALTVLAGHVLVLVGLHALVLSTTHGIPRGGWLDLLLGGCVVSAVVAFALGPWLAANGIGAVGGLALVGRLALVVTMALMAWSAVAVRGRSRDARLELLGAAATTFLLAEVTGLLLLTGGLSASPLALGVVGAGRMVAVGLFAVAALSPPGPRADVAPPLRGVRVVMATVLSTACVLLAVDHVAWLPALPDSAWLLAVGVLLLGGVRMTVLTGEVAQLVDERRLAVTDPLTGLQSRRGLREALDHPGGGALLLLDLDGFKEVNDRCGQAVGDEVLRVVADRLRRASSGPRVVARLGADEFALLLLGADAPRAAETAGRALAAVTLPVVVGDRLVRVAASAGLATREPGHSAEEVLRRADVAMQQAKRSGGGLERFDEALDAGARHRERLLDDLRALLGAPASQTTAGRVVAHYQPQLDADGTVSGVEALVRWEHPELGLLQPVAFIDLAEEHGLLPELTERVLRQAVAEAAAWRAQGHDLRVAVNLSASCLDWPRLLDVVDDVLDSRLVPAEALVLEVTETGLVSDAAHGLEVAAQLVERGIELSIDDYGTGYSSLAHLNHLPARELKLDRAFTRRLLEDQRTATIVRATIDLAHDLGMRLVAEGVEDDATLQAITAIGCDVTQGYWHSRPLPASELTSWLHQRSRGAITRA